MSKLTELLDELCPDGVEYRPVGEVAELQRGTSITKKKVVAGDVPVVAGGRQPAYFHNEANREGETIVVAGSGAYAGYVSWWDRPIFVSDAFSIKSADSELSNRFCYYWLNSIQELLHQSKSGGGVPHVYAKDVARLKMPVPPLEVQQEIVRVLDAFTDLEQSLVSELELRKKQYVEYRDTAIEDLVNGNVPSVHLGDHARTVNGLTGKNKSDFSDGNAKFITYRNVFSNPEVNLETNDYVKVAEGEKQNQVELGDVIFTGSSESREEVGFSAVVTQTPAEPIYLNSFCFVVRFEDPEFIDPGFAKHMFRSRPIRKQIMKAANGVTRINISKPRFMRVEIPVPPMEMQQEIAVKLDAFSSLIQSIEQEISLRRKQYEFYRDELLSFAPKED